MFKLRLAFYEWQLSRAIRRHGWTGVPVGDFDADEPSWVYSVGFYTSLGAPEILIFDIPLADAYRLLWTAYEELKAGELVIVEGLAWAGEGDINPVWREVHPTRRKWGWVTFANWWAAKKNLPPPPVFQLVLPDRTGAFPWDLAYQNEIRPRQPELYLPDDREKLP